jgi:hypothetical protein
MAIDWTTSGTNATGGPPEATVDAQGRVVLQFRNIYEDAATGRFAAMALVAEVDGPVHQAIFTPYAPTTATGIWLLQAGVAPGKSLWKIIDWDSNPMRRSAIGGDDDLLTPGVLFALDASRGAAWAGPRWPVEVLPDAYRVIAWDTGDEVATAWQGSDASIPRFVGDVLYFSFTAPTNSALWIWTLAGGAVPLHGYGDDPTRAVGGLGTDGVDMVWLEGEGTTATPGVFTTRSIHGAPFTTEPSTLQPRRVRAWEGEQLDTTYPPAVGCGYAAFVNPSAWTLVIVRLQDGAAWSIRSPQATPPAGICRWRSPAARCSPRPATTSDAFRSRRSPRPLRRGGAMRS